MADPVVQHKTEGAYMLNFLDKRLKLQLFFYKKRFCSFKFHIHMQSHQQSECNKND